VRLTLAILFAYCCLSTHAARAQFPWTACDTGGRSVTLRQDAGDLITLPFPGLSGVPLRVALLTTPNTGSISGRTITATFWIATSNPAYTGANAGGCINAVNMRLYFTTTTGSYRVGQADKNPSRYWWSQAGSCYIEQVDDGTLVTITSTVTPGQWSNANGQLSSNLPNEFNAAAATAKQLGLSFGGGCYYDTGVGVSSGSATLHLISFDVQ
jgi:hypothetical protein